jgi:hypothetical protein
LQELRAAARDASEADIGSAKLALARRLVYIPIYASEGTVLLDQLAAQGVKQADIPFLRCVGLFHAGDYFNCSAALRIIMLSEPTNERAAALLELFKEVVYRDAKRGLLVAAGVVAAGVALALLYAYWPRGQRGVPSRPVAPHRAASGAIGAARPPMRGGMGQR